MTVPFAIAGPGTAAAIIAGRKTQMRVLAQSPLAGVRPGDRVTVREACIPGRYVGGEVYATSLAKAEFAIFADGWRQHRDGSVVRGRRPTNPDYAWIAAIQMPRWAPRMTLLIDRVRPDRLRQIGRADVRAEGVRGWAGLLWRGPGSGMHLSPRRAFARHWDIDHHAADERWRDDPAVVVLGFSAVLSGG